MGAVQRPTVLAAFNRWMQPVEVEWVIFLFGEWIYEQLPASQKLGTKVFHMRFFDGADVYGSEIDSAVMNTTALKFSMRNLTSSIEVFTQ